MPRFVIIGTSCSGKTTLARRIAAQLQIHHIELDACFWGPGWAPQPDAVFRETLAEQTSRQEWVVDGNFSQVRDLLWGRATHLIWLNYSFPLVFSRVVWRTLRRIIQREQLFSGNRETFRSAFFSRRSIIWWVVKTWYPYRREYRQLFDSPTFTHLQQIEQKQPRDTKQWLRELSQ